MARWSFWVDRGGTFTDVIARAPDGALTVEKLLSRDPARYVDAAAHGIFRVMGKHAAPEDRIGEVRLGSTVATNALLERAGSATALAITAGFADLLLIGDQTRPRLFDRHIRRSPPLWSRVVEVHGRRLADGTLRQPLDLDRARADLTAVFAEGYRALAIVLMHAWTEAADERALAALAAEIGFTQISASHEVAPLIGIVARGESTVLDAYLSPPLRAYLDGLADALGADADLQVMQSNGGLVPARRCRGRDAVLSGPAGGVVGMAEVARRLGLAKAVGFDMGGTSTDVSHVAGELERDLEREIAGVRVCAPMIRIETIAAGGGSICAVEDGRLRLGPRSAGADPGPACYRRGGPLTLTDCNAVLGRLDVEGFPAVFGPGGDQPLDVAASAARLSEAREALRASGGEDLLDNELAEGFLAIAVEAMARAIKRISVDLGHDLADHALIAFGGAGGQHACRVAEAVGIGTVVVSPLAGVLSAWGIGRARTRTVRQRTLRTPLRSNGAALNLAFGALEAELLDADGESSDPFGTWEHRVRRLHLRLATTDTLLPLVVDEITIGRIEADFERAYRARFGFFDEAAEVIVERIEIERIIGRDKPDGVEDAPADRLPPIPAKHADAEIEGPALIRAANGAVMIEAGWRGAVRDTGDLVIRRTRASASQRAGEGRAAADPVRLELFGHRFAAIADEMGAALRDSARSVNIKERRDYSCAVFDADGELIANAPHMPVHLGSMGDSVRQVIARAADGGEPLTPGEAHILNNPYGGGAHLPDITLVMPVFDPAGGTRAAFVAARGHHADVGGITPGSMPPFSRSIEEEGVLIEAFAVVRGGRFDEDRLRRLLGQGPYPARDIDQNIADVRAQIAACARGARQLEAAFAEHGAATVVDFMGRLRAASAAAVRRRLARLPSGAFTCEADDGWRVSVAIHPGRHGEDAVFDFRGSDPQLASNFNAPPSIVRAASLYFLRALIEEDIPLNDGCLEPVRLIIPPGSLLDPVWPAAVVAGNVETSQLLVDALFAAAGAMAASQGTMNNLTFGDETRQYYETIGGGSGAGPDFDGADAVQTHMTNSRITDPEVLEARFPVMVEAFSIRRGSGGAGRRRGGDGAVRRLRFLEPMSLSILANRRRVAPFGLAGGLPGAPGRNYVQRADGRREDLPGRATVRLAPGDVFVVMTPGGGGFGEPPTALAGDQAAVGRAS